MHGSGFAASRTIGVLRRIAWAAAALGAAWLVVAHGAPATSQTVECPDRAAGVPLASAILEEGDTTRLICEYMPEEAGSTSPFTIVAAWSPAGGDPTAVEACGREDTETEADGTWSGVTYGTAAASVTFTVEDLSLGARREAIRRSAGDLLAAIDPLAAECRSVEIGVPIEELCADTYGIGSVAAADAHLDDGYATVTCDYQPRDTETINLSPVRVVIRFAGPDDSATPECGIPPEVVEADGTVTGTLYGGTTAIAITWTALQPDAGYDTAFLWSRAEELFRMVEGEAAACPATTDGYDPAAGLPPWAAVPPQPALAPELDAYGAVMKCPEQIAGFRLTEQTEPYPTDFDWLSVRCVYTREGVDPDGAETADTAEILVSWFKENGRRGRYCRDEDSVSENESRRFVDLYDSRARSLRVSLRHPLDGDAAAFDQVGAALVETVRPLSYPCPDFNEIVFDPIPPYWQPLFGSDPPPPPIHIPDEVDAADLDLDAGATGTTGTNAPVETTTTTQGTDTTAGAGGPATTTGSAAAPGDDEADGRSGIWRVLGIGAQALSVLGMVLALATARRRSRVRPSWDVLRLVIAAATIVAMTVFVGVTTPVTAIIIGVGLGGALGFMQGRSLDVAVTDGVVFARRSLVGVAVFAGGVVVTQAAGLANRADMVSLGLGVGFLGMATTAGIMVGRRSRVAAARGGTVIMLALLLGAGLVLQVGGATPTEAQEQPSAEDEAFATLLDLVDWDRITLIGGLWATQQKPVVTVAIPPGLQAPPDPVEHSASWTSGDRDIELEITETYTFSLTEDGVCCDVAYSADGTRTDGDTVDTYHVEASITGFVPVYVFGGPIRVPFGDPDFYTGTGLDPVPCGRPVATSDNFWNETTWTVYEVNGTAESRSGGPELSLLADCDLPGFTFDELLADMPPPPPADDEARYQDSVGPCPVLQEILLPIVEAAELTTASSYTMGKLLYAPNQAACDNDADLGIQQPGETQIQMWWKLASTDPEYETARQNEVNEDFISRTRQYNLYDDEACPLDENGDVLPPPEGEECYRSQFFSVGSEVWVWTEWVRDGSNLELRGRLPWGSYYVVCHHCTPGTPVARNAIGALHRAGAASPAATGSPGGTTSPSVPVPGGDDDGASPGGEETVDVPDGAGGPEPAVPDGGGDEVDPRDAAVAALVGLLGSAGLLGSVLAETGMSLADAMRTWRDGTPVGDGTGSPTSPPQPPPPPGVTVTEGLPGFGMGGLTAGDVMDAWRRGGIEGVRNLLPGDVPLEDGAPAPFPDGRELQESEGAAEVLERVPDHVRDAAESRVRSELESEAVEAARARARAAVGEVDPSLEDMGEVLRGNEGVDEALGGLPDDVAREVRSELVAELERERVDRAAAEARAALERQRAVELVRDAIGDNDAERIDQIMERLPDDDARGEVWERAGGSEVSIDEMRAGQQPGTGGPAPDRLLPESDEDIRVAVTTNPDLDEVLEELPEEVRSEVVDRVRSELESEAVEAARARARAAVGEVDPSLEDMGEVLRGNEGVDEALGGLPDDVAREVRSELVAELERERVDRAAAEARHALELDRAEAAVRSAVEAGDARRAYTILGGLGPDDAETIRQRIEGALPPR